MSEPLSGRIRYALLFIAGVISFLLTLYGCFLLMFFGYRNPIELSLGLCLVLPFPCFLLRFISLPWSVMLFWVDFVGLWFVRAFGITPNGELNPLDSLGAMYLCPVLAISIALYLTPKSPEVSQESEKQN